MDKPEVPLEHQIIRILEGTLRAFVEAAEEQGRRLAEILQTKEGREALNHVRDSRPDLASIANGLEKFAAGLRDRRLINPIGRPERCLAECNPLAQKDALEQGIPWPSTNDPKDTVIVWVNSMREDQRKEIFDTIAKRIRTPQEIIALRRSQVPKLAPVPNGSERVKLGKGFVVFQGFRIDKRELAQWLAEI